MGGDDYAYMVSQRQQIEQRLSQQPNVEWENIPLISDTTLPLASLTTLDPHIPGFLPRLGLDTKGCLTTTEWLRQLA